MNNKYLLDTNICIALLDRPEDIKQHLIRSVIYLPCIVVGELIYGAKHSTKEEYNLDRYQKFIFNTIVLGCDRETAFIYGTIKSNLAKKGISIPTNDGWIAAIALQNELTVVTRDRHFDHLDGLKVECW